MSAPADHHPEIGVMLYDNPKECKAGWASIAGAEAMYMRSHADLANHVIWVTNSEFSAFQMLGHRHVHNLRGTSFFPHAAVSNGRRSRHSNGRPFCKICRAATGQNCDAYFNAWRNGLRMETR